MSSSKQPENPLVNIVVNVLIPVILLSKCSQEGPEIWNLGPYKAMGIALGVPMAFGIWYFIKYRTPNAFSLIGVLNVVLTGVITIILFEGSDSVRANVAPIFGIKEAIQPLILGSLFLISHRSKSPLFNAFIYSEGLFDISRIEKEVKERSTQADYQNLLWSSTKLFFGSFVISAILNVFLAYYFLRDLSPGAENWKVLYNEDVAKITGWGYLVIGAPLLVIGGFILFRLIKGLSEITGLQKEEVMMAR